MIAPTERGYRLTQLLGIAVGLLAWIGLMAHLTSGRLRDALMAGMVLPLVGVGTATARTLVAQRDWKLFWTRSLTGIMQHASASDQHDLFMRAAQMKAAVESERVIPLTDVQRAVVLAAAVVQLVVDRVAPIARLVWN